MTFEEMVELRKNNHDQFIKTIFENCQNRDFFNGEIMLKSFKEITKDDKKSTVAVDKWIFFTPDEKNTLIEMAKKEWEEKKEEILKECEIRYDRTENHPFIELYENTFVSMIICASLDEGQKIPEWLFLKACRLFDKHRENEDTLWKSYMFKGFVTWAQIDYAMKHRDNSNSRAE